MLSEDFDKKIKEAADHHYPAYDEHAWKGMKKLLDKHMPEEEDKKRRGFFFVLFFLLLGGGAAIVFMTQPFKRKQDKTMADVTSTLKNIASDTQYSATGKEKTGVEKNNPSTEVEKPNTTVADNVVNTHEPARSKLIPGNSSGNSSLHNGNADLVTGGGGSRIQVRFGQAGIKKKTSNTTSHSGKDNSDTKATLTATTTPVASPSNNNLIATNNKNNPSADDSKKRNTDSSSSPIRVQADNITDKKTKSLNDKTTDAPLTEEKKVAAKTKTITKKKSAFFITLSAGPDVSYTTGDKLGKMKLLGGTGIGYTYKEKITLRTGFYTGRKIYTTSPANYSSSGWVNLYYPNLQKVEADCKVYEIPFSLSYNFGNKPSYNWFVSAGVSTLIMKRETYNYFYKYIPAGPTLTQSHTIYNENKHLFSVLTLSAGYQRRFGNKVSFIAEPYIKLPLSGVGGGKVMLNSTGVLFTVTVNPFNKVGNKNSGK